MKTISGNLSDFIASLRCWFISSLGQRNALSGTVSVAVSTPVAKPGTGVPAVAGLIATVPCALHVQLRTVDVPETVKSMVGGAWASGVAGPATTSQQTTAANAPRDRPARLTARTRCGSPAS